MADDDLNIHITADGDDAAAAIQAAIDKFLELKVKMNDAADAGSESAATIADGASRMADAVEGAAEAQTAAAGQMVGSLRTVSAAQQAVLDDLRGNFARMEAANTSLTDAEIAQRVRWLENERQMGRLSLEAEQQRLAELQAMTEAQTTARIATERAVQLVNAELVAQSIAEMRAEAAAGVISADEQVRALQSIAAEAEYSLKVRSLASEEVLRIEKAAAVESAQAVVAAEREKRAAASETALQYKEMAYTAMDVGYAESSLGLKGGKTLADLSYLARDFTAAGAGMVVQMGLIGIAVAAVTEGIAFLGAGMKRAGDEAGLMDTIRVAVERQGDSWDQASESIQRFAEHIQDTTEYSKTEALDAVRALEVSGLHYADAEHVVAAATDIAAATHENLREVIQKVISAEGARAAGLEKLDPKVKDLIEHHASLRDVIDKMADDMQGHASQALDTMDGKTKNLGNEINQLGTDIGAFTNGPLASFVSGLDNAVRGMRDFLAWQQQIDSQGSRLQQIPDSQQGVAPRRDAPREERSILDQPVGSGRGGDTESAQFRNALANVQAYFQARKIGYDEALQEEEALQSKYKLTTEQTDQLHRAVLRLGEEEAARARAGERAGAAAERRQEAAARRAERAATAAPKDFGSLIGDDAKPSDGLADQQKTLDATLKALAGSEDEYREAVKTAGSETARTAAEMALANKVHVDARVAVDQLSGAIASDRAQLAEATAEQTRHTEAAAALREAYNALLERVQAHHRATTQEQEDLKNLRAAYELHNKAAADAGTAISTLNGNIETNSASLATNTARLDENREAQAKVNIALEEMARRYFANQSAQETANVLASNERQQQLADELATYDRSLAAQLAYYEQRYAAEVAAGGQYSSEAESTMQKILAIELDEYKQRLDAQKSFITEMQTAEYSLLDDIISKHESFHSILHGIFQSIADDFIKMVERMIVEQPLLTQLEKSMTGIFGGASAAGGAGGLGGIGAGAPGLGGGTGNGTASTAYGALGAFFGPSGASQALGQFDTSSYTAFWAGTSTASQIQQQQDAAANNTANATGGASLGANPTAAQLDALGIPNPNGSDSGLKASGGSGLIGTALSGAGIGATIGSLTGGNETNASIGGSLGSLAGNFIGTLGGATGGPLGSLIGSALGGVLGSLFGSHANPGSNPDEFEGQTGYGQDVANLQGGQAGASGVAYYPSQAIEQFIAAENVGPGTINGLAGAGQQSLNSNGTIASSGGIDAAEIWLAQNKNDTAQQLEQLGVSPAQFQQWVQQLGESATGSGQYSHIAGDPNIGDIEVTGATAGGGTKTTYSQLAADLNSIITASSGSTGVIPTFAVTRSYANPSLVTGTTQTGTYLPTPTNLLGTPGANTTATIDPTTGQPIASGSRSVGGTVAALQAPGSTSPTVSVTINGNVVGPGGMEDISNEIAVALGRLQGGLVPGSNSGVTKTVARFTGGS